MFFWWIRLYFVFSHVQRLYQFNSGLIGQNCFVDISQFGTFIGGGEVFPVFADGFFFRCCIGLAIQDIYCAFGSHDGNFGCRVGKIDIAACFLARHDDIGAAVGFARDERYFGYGCLRVGVNDFCAVADNAVVFLYGSGKKTGYIFKCDNRDIEAVTKPDKAGNLVRSVDVEYAG